MSVTLLPAGHEWKGVADWPCSSETAFHCKHCDQTFIHDMIDDSNNTEEVEDCGCVEGGAR